ncbi:ferric-rhodotorulic acid/ferric-coprogen receptor FhuE [Variovorax sp. J22G73]|uniref:ferric-rhodotorulic acid/ferric-coprogen receptor FhuE n=1 Tax=unclassified Variovorax TaxID=663243 RepID=UPI0025782A2A|nr:MULTISPECIES: ferric-rhodotorulic acid/ferric-coprogen receptor FhuE [unclassified Variovorax]MDM0004942.1 ferric-rhodotorulic acid/ferric-coprogen receptor FhuE [Variovorax sp. J22R203]MDM0098358.1 ferric-rhodotorulic acid/ferric-coprogen receptor FhuE [Variovorax sp. J22G73]
MRKPHFTLTPLALAGLLIVGMHGAAHAQTAPVVSVSITAQPLGQALNELARQADLQLSFPAALVAGRAAPAVSGRLSARQALNRLLAGSGLVAHIEGATVTVQPAPSASVADGATLAAVTVSADADRSGTTEGTGSYTTRNTSAATGLSLSLKETPQSVTVVTQQRIEDQRMQNLSEVLANTTGISSSLNDGSRMTYFSRGFSITNFQYDGIPTAATSNWYAGETELDAALYDRVEVVRGATGLLTGAGNPSASINLVRKHADSKVFAGEVSLGAGSWDNYRGSVDLSTPITADGRVRGRVVAAYQDKASYVSLSNVKKQVFYAVVDADLTPATRLSVGVDYQDNDPKGTPWGGFPLWFSDGSRTNWNRSATPGADWSYWASRTETAFATLEHRFDNEWKANLGLTHSKQSLDTKLLFLIGWPDQVTGLGMRAIGSVYQGYREQDSVSAQLSGPLELLGRKHELTFGLLGSEQKYKYDYRQAQDLAPVVFLNGGIGAYPEPNWGTPRTLDEGTIKQQGLYGAGRFSLGDATHLIVGGRYSNWNNTTPDTQRKHSKFTPYAGLTHDLGKDTTLYASYTSIFNPQDYRDRGGRYLDPVEGKSYEVGVKNSLYGGKVNTSLSVFRIQQDNLAQMDGDHLVPDTLDQAYYGAQGVRSTGFEIDVSGELAPGWNVFGGFTHYTAKDASRAAVETNQPRTLLRLFSTYRLTGGWSNLTLGGGVNWQSSNFTIANGPNGKERVQQGAYALVSLMARYQFNPRLSLQVNINNAFDKKYYSQIGYYAAGAWGAPRNVMATMNYKF